MARGSGPSLHRCPRIYVGLQQKGDGHDAVTLFVTLSYLRAPSWNSNICRVIISQREVHCTDQVFLLGLIPVGDSDNTV